MGIVTRKRNQIEHKNAETTRKDIRSKTCCWTFLGSLIDKFKTIEQLRLETLARQKKLSRQGKEKYWFRTMKLKRKARVEWFKKRHRIIALIILILMKVQQSVEVIEKKRPFAKNWAFNLRWPVHGLENFDMFQRTVHIYPTLQAHKLHYLKSAIQCESIFSHLPTAKANYDEALKLLQYRYNKFLNTIARFKKIYKVHALKTEYREVLGKLIGFFIDKAIALSALSNNTKVWFRVSSNFV